MSHEEAVDIKRHVRTYILVFVALAFFTIVTVSVSYLHLQPLAAITVAMVIATIKGTLVVCYFMHLISEKKLIYGILLFTLVCFLILIFLILFTDQGMMRSTSVS